MKALSLSDVGPELEVTNRNFVTAVPGQARNFRRSCAYVSSTRVQRLGKYCPRAHTELSKFFAASPRTRRELPTPAYVCNRSAATIILYTRYNNFESFFFFPLRVHCHNSSLIRTRLVAPRARVTRIVDFFFLPLLRVLAIPLHQLDISANSERNWKISPGYAGDLATFSLESALSRTCVRIDGKHKRVYIIFSSKVNGRDRLTAIERVFCSCAAFCFFIVRAKTPVALVAASTAG